MIEKVNRLKTFSLINKKLKIKLKWWKHLILLKSVKYFPKKALVSFPVTPTHFKCYILLLSLLLSPPPTSSTTTQPTHPRQYPAINLLQSWPLISLDTISCRAPSSLVISHCHHHFPPLTVIVIEDFRCNKTIGYYFSICNQTTKNKLFSTWMYLLII